MSMQDGVEFYNRLAAVYDVMTDWPARLNYELPFLLETLQRHEARTVLDAACGTGWHAIALAQRGYTVTACDASPAMLERARDNAAQARVEVTFCLTDLTHLALTNRFDAILCLGNSLPHLLWQTALNQALRRMRAQMNSGGVLVLHNLNYDLRLKTQPRFFAANGNADTLVWRFADYGPEFITFHTALFEPSASGWSVQVNSTLQRPLLKNDLDNALTPAGFVNVRHFGGLDGSPFNADTSADLVIVAEA